MDKSDPQALIKESVANDRRCEDNCVQPFVPIISVFSRSMRKSSRQ